MRRHLTLLLCAVLAVCFPEAAHATRGAPPTFPVPIVSVFTLTSRNPETVGLVVQWSKRCVTVSQCPTRWALSVVRQSRSAEGNFGWGTERDTVLTRVRDTVLVLRPWCPLTGGTTIDTMQIAVRSIESASVNTSKLGTVNVALRCRQLTSAERAEVLALADSFPHDARRIESGDAQYRLNGVQRLNWLADRMRISATAADTAASIADFQTLETLTDSRPSVRDLSGRLVMPVGYTAGLCIVARNRYTGQVIILSGDLLECEPPRQRFASTRSG